MEGTSGTGTSVASQSERTQCAIAAAFADHQNVAAATLDALGADIQEFAQMGEAALQNGGRLYFFGNGGSAADAQHLAAEFVVRYRNERRALPAMALTTDSSILTAAANDYSFEDVFARQIEAFGRPGDLAVGISTSGNSENVLRAVDRARANGIATVGLTGGSGGKLAERVDLCLTVPSAVTARIQEMHILIGHLLCELLDHDHRKEAAR